MSTDPSTIYDETALAVCLVLGRARRLKSAVYDSNFKSDIRKIYALACKTLDSVKILDRTLMNSGLVEGADRAHLSANDLSEGSTACQFCLLCVLAYDLLYRGKFARHDITIRRLYNITNDSKSSNKLRRAYKEAIRSSKAHDLGSIEEVEMKRIKLPCYARVNKLLTSLDEILTELNSNGLEQIIYEVNSVSYKRFLKKVRKLQNGQFMLDYHLHDELLIFPSATSITNLDLYKAHKLVIQDKASCLVPVLLRPEPDADILDACAAPGNKTLQMISLLSSEATLFAIDRDPTRFRRLCENLAASGADRLSVVGPTDVNSLPHNNEHSAEGNEQPRVELICADFLSIDPADPRFARVKYILLDPSCSGSGLYLRQPDGDVHTGEKTKMNSTALTTTTTVPRPTEVELQHEQNADRLKRLSNLQACLLHHALEFPNVKRVIYSTCSVNTEENENVITECVQRHGDQFKLKQLWSTVKHTPRGSRMWKNRGHNELACEACIRARPEEDLTIGFFIACFELKKSRYSVVPQEGRGGKRKRTVKTSDSSNIEKEQETKEPKAGRNKSRKKRRKTSADKPCN
ncbi:unnamed protein product [Calicophoron daubneyi]|uniref:SAM-dependent MTase RsmB/NOP-type domain-containing protein n=1 Tax=Calicophoron daubneyi TaxID=300641 RepID=A0AAV2TD32_CALDB